MVTSGPMHPGCHEGKHFTLSEYVAKRMSHMLGKISLSPGELHDLRAEAFPTIGSCQGMYTANSMAIFAEALGVTLPRCATIHAVDSRKLETAKLSGMRIVDMVEEDLRPDAIMTEAAFKNALQVGLATGASTNLCTHIPAIASEAGISITIDDFDSLSRKTPQLCDTSPAGPHVMLDIDRAGGVRAIMKELSPMLDLEARTVTGKTVKEEIANINVSNREVIRPLDNPIAEEGGLVALRGSLAPEGAIARPTSFPPSCFRFEGIARCFSNAEEASLAVLGGQINNGDIVIVRYEGLKGGPGAREISLLPYMINSLGHDQVGMITDGRLSGSNKGAIICHVTPEAYVGGPLALVVDGDKILIDIHERRLDLLVSEEELQARRQSWQQPEHQNIHGYLKRYISEVNTLHEGALQERGNPDD
jgi:dihydroxy-acid dehydratase